MPGLSCLAPWHTYPGTNTLGPSCSLGHTQTHSQTHRHRGKRHCSPVHTNTRTHTEEALLQAGACTHTLTHTHSPTFADPLTPITHLQGPPDRPLAGQP